VQPLCGYLLSTCLFVKANYDEIRAAPYFSTGSCRPDI
jgi:hypothetical protein